MKRYTKPSLRFNQVRPCNVITTSEPQVYDDPNADPNNPVLAPQRGKDWEDW